MIFAATLVPPAMVLSILLIIWFCIPQSTDLILVIMRNIISKKNIYRRPTYFMCRRPLSLLNRNQCMLTSIFIISICVQCFFVLAIVDVTHQCINDPDMDCFKRRDDVEINRVDKYGEYVDHEPYIISPVNCSLISRDDFVLCYRITMLDPGRAFTGAVAAYVLFKFLNFGLLIVAHIMLWVAQKVKKTTLSRFRSYLSYGYTMALALPFFLRVMQDEVQSAFPLKLSLTELVQVVFVVIVFMHFVSRLLWEEFKDSEAYLGDASLPRSNFDVNESKPNIEQVIQSIL